MSEYPEEARENYMNRKLRLDADGDDEERREPTGSGGNTRLPYGLCEQFGIPLPKDAKPHDAWAALAGKGIKPEAVYKYLDVHGTVKGFQPEEKTSTGNNPVNKGKPVSFTDKVKKLKVSSTEKTAILDRQKQVDEFFNSVKKRMADGKPIGSKRGENIPHLKYSEGTFSTMQSNVFYGKPGYDDDTIKAVKSVDRSGDAIEKVAWLDWELWNSEKEYNKTGLLQTYSRDVKSDTETVGKVQRWVDEDIADGEIKDWLQSTLNDYKKKLQQRTEFVESEKTKRRELIDKIHKEDRSKDLSHTSTKRKTGIKTFTHYGDYDGVRKNLNENYNMDVSESITKVGGMTVDKANQMSDALQTVYEDYGFKPRHVWKGIPRKSGVRMQWSFSSCSFEPVNLWKIDDNPQTDYYKQKKNGFNRWTVDASVKGITVHELGHGLMSDNGYHSWSLLTDYVKNYAKSRDKLFKKNYKNLHDGNMTWGELEQKAEEDFNSKGYFITDNDKDLARKWMAVNNAYARAKFNGDIYNLSEYGASEYEEFFAESFVQYKMGEEMPDYMVEMVELFLN